MENKYKHNKIKRKIDILTDMGFTVLHVPEFDYFDIRLESKNFVFIRTIGHEEFLQSSESKIIKEFTDEAKEVLVHKDKVFYNHKDLSPMFKDKDETFDLNNYIKKM